MVGFFGLVLLVYVIIPLSLIFGLYYRFRNSTARNNVIVISLDQAPRHLTDIDAEQMFRKVEIELALQQEVQRLSPKEKEWLLCFLKMNYKEIQKHFGCGHTYVYEKRKKLAETMKALKE